MNEERLLKMAEFLEALPPHKFDFSNYVHIGDKSPAAALAAPDEHCGTTACAVGWMPAVFPETFEWTNVTSTWDRTPLLPHPIGSTSWYWPEVESVIKDFLDLEDVQYNFLFIPGDSPLDNLASARAVARQIREFIADGGEIAEEWRNRYE